ncbi:hypothetical protein SAMN04489841_4382 [Natrinema salaciae]|uniref:Uncharacterized protein n=1 Tax=Natrinema salaciae TaxID=1186196 RepID=A0A1H9RFX8_9EURY|nr:hypothetical protein SAMN04489841_4382 [Natrinema salaciae]
MLIVSASVEENGVSRSARTRTGGSGAAGRDSDAVDAYWTIETTWSYRVTSLDSGS